MPEGLCTVLLCDSSSLQTPGFRDLPWPTVPYWGVSGPGSVVPGDAGGPRSTSQMEVLAIMGKHSMRTKRGARFGAGTYYVKAFLADPLSLWVLVLGLSMTRPANTQPLLSKNPQLMGMFCKLRLCSHLFIVIWSPQFICLNLALDVMEARGGEGIRL